MHLALRLAVFKRRRGALIRLAHNRYENRNSVANWLFGKIVW